MDDQTRAIERDEDDAGETGVVHFADRVEYELKEPVKWVKGDDEEIVTVVKIYNLTVAEWLKCGSPYKIDDEESIVPNLKAWKKAMPRALRRPPRFMLELSPVDFGRIGMVLIGFFAVGVRTE